MLHILSDLDISLRNRKKVIFSLDLDIFVQKQQKVYIFHIQTFSSRNIKSLILSLDLDTFINIQENSVYFLQIQTLLLRDRKVYIFGRCFPFQQKSVLSPSDFFKWEITKKVQFISDLVFFFKKYKKILNFLLFQTFSLSEKCIYFIQIQTLLLRNCKNVYIFCR